MTDPLSLFQLVVVGSSAGGIEALSTLVATLPTDFSAPVVIAQHLDPARPSHLAQILARRAHLPVITVQDHEPLTPGTIYVVPSNSHVAITDHDLSLLPDAAGRPKPSVDLLLSSAAAVFGEQLIAVILTGTGSDGTAGAVAVKQAGGTVIIQDPDTAAYPGMPQSLAPETVDVVAELAQIGPLLHRLLAGESLPPPSNGEPALHALLEQLHTLSGLDFRLYKRATILRRLQRRIVTTASGDLAGYRAYLAANPDEQQRLISSFLIKVTQFMRDPEMFDYLRTELLPALHAALPAQDAQLRFWSAGCATGEEAYSLAILLCEELGEDLERVGVKIFATDVDVDAVTFARHGVYPAAALATLPPALVARYFVRSGDSYTVTKRVRGLVVFGEHDLSQRAPFPNINLVLCRNVLIYFTRELQQRALQLFAFALHDGGTLVLGRTESVSPLADYFAPVSTQQNIYRRRGPRLPAPLMPVGRGTAALAQRRERRERHERRTVAQDLLQAQQALQQARSGTENLLLHLPVGVVVVDSRYDIQSINAAARRLLRIYGSGIGDDLVHLAQHVPPRELRAAIDQALRAGVVTQLDAITIADPLTEVQPVITMTCYPHPPGQGKAPAAHALLLVTDVTALVGDRESLAAAVRRQHDAGVALAEANAQLERANAALALRSEELQQAVEAREQARVAAEERAARHARQLEQVVALNRELLAANEELSQTNASLRVLSDTYVVRSEEAQAAVEEIETLNEEMQASNEELETLNEELQATVEELNTANADMAARATELTTLAETLEAERRHSAGEAARLAAILAGIADAVLVVDQAGITQLANATYTRWFGAAPRLADEEGHPLTAEQTPQARAARGEAFSITFTVTQDTGERRWYEALGQPVQGEGSQLWNVVVIRDISERSLRRLQEQFLGLVSHELRTPLTTIIAALGTMEQRLPKEPAAQRYLQMAVAQAKRLARLIDDLWEITRLQQGTFSLNLAPVALRQIVVQTVEVAQSIAPHQTIHLTTTEEPFLLQGDADRLQQVVLNLLNNAIVHAPQSSQIEVRLERLANNRVALVVEDAGLGIPPEQLANLFNRTAPDSPRRKAQGLGLGLFIAHQIVTAHGGTIAVRSTVGEGTTFTVMLPLLIETPALTP
ncbi:MAG: hypothetical protein RLZZ387_5491 [Chloroflexota bacterium]